VSCSRCQGIQPLHKGYTRWTWALRSVSEGDDIVLVVGDNIYKLQGDKDQVLKYMESKAKVTGNLEGRTLAVQTIARPDNKK
jgi:dTDP-glucose pyrophosphorylase